MFTLYPYNNKKRLLSGKDIDYNKNNNCFDKLPILSLCLKNKNIDTLNDDIVHLLEREKNNKIMNNDKIQYINSNGNNDILIIRKDNSNSFENYPSKNYRYKNQKEDSSKILYGKRKLRVNNLSNFNNTKLLRTTKNSYNLKENSLGKNDNIISTSYKSLNNSKNKNNIRPKRNVFYKTQYFLHSKSSNNIFEYPSKNKIAHFNFSKSNSLANISVKKSEVYNSKYIIRNSSQKIEKRPKTQKKTKKPKNFHSSIKTEILNYNDLIIKLKRLKRINEICKNLKVTTKPYRNIYSNLEPKIDFKEQLNYRKNKKSIVFINEENDNKKKLIRKYNDVRISKNTNNIVDVKEHNNKKAKSRIISVYLNYL